MHQSPSESLQKPSTLCNRDKDDIKCTSLSFSVALTYDVTEPLHGNPGGGNPRRAVWGGRVMLNINLTNIILLENFFFKCKIPI